MQPHIAQQPPFRQEVLKELDRFVGDNLTLLLPVERAWQASELLPDMAAENWRAQIESCRNEAAALPDDLLVTLVANMITEEALPNYHAWLSNLETGFDKQGVGQGGIARWMRGWVAEEKRHGEALHLFLYSCGRVDLKAVSRTIQYLLRNGFDPQTENDVYLGFMYTSLQERATYVAHSGVARMARQYDNTMLARMCDHIAGDEVRHEKAYARFVTKLFQLDPDGALLALQKMLSKSIVMPAKLMSDGQDPDIFSLFSAITQKNGLYTTHDYARIVTHFVSFWNVANINAKSDDALRAQDYICELPERFTKFADRVASRQANIPDRPIKWLFNRIVSTVPLRDRTSVATHENTIPFD